METIAAEPEKDNEYGQNGKYSDYEIKDAARTIIDAEKCKADPDKMKYVQKCLDRDHKATKKAITSIQGLRDRQQERAKEKDMEYGGES